MNKTVTVYTLGCKVNQYESEAIAELFEENGFCVTHSEAPSDIYIINTCTVTAESDRKARQFIRRAISGNPNAYILVTGCMAQSRTEQVKSISGVDYICGSSNKMTVVAKAMALMAQGSKNQIPEIDIPSLKDSGFEKMSIKKFERIRAYVKIEDGCENRCSYCAIPDARGPVRSKPIEEVVCEVKRLTDGGCREIVLTGIESASYGRDFKNGTSITSLLEEIDKIPGIGRVRIGSIDPSVMTENFVNKISKIKCLTPHFHISMQSGSTRILGLMKRKYNRDMALRSIERLRHAIPDVMLTTDFIVGFPTETDEDFSDTLDFAKKADFLDMHVFAYSKREGTPAAAMQEQISDRVKKERSAALIALGERLTEGNLRRFAERNSETEVLFETWRDGTAYGHTASFVPFSVPSVTALGGELLTVRVKGSGKRECIGVLKEDLKQ